MGGVNRQETQLLGERYRLVERLGAGGMSVVWRGYDEVLGRQVAIKVLAPRLAADRAFRHRIRLEAKAAARLCHPHITNVYDYGESVDGNATLPYVVMELVDGETLAGRLARGGPLPWREAVIVCAEVAAALATAHSRGIVHRDVTPGNVMLTHGGAKVLDFGISALIGERDADPDGSVLGTPAYLAPERLDGGQVSPATDVYALGLILYRSLTGRLPWAASTKTEMLRAHLYHDPAPLPPVPGLPEEIGQLTAACLAKSPVDRPSSAEVARTLGEAAGIVSILPVSPAPAGVRSAADVDDLGSDTDLANAGTTILPSSAATDAFSLPGSRSGQVRQPSRAARRRRLEAAAVGVGLVAVTGAVWGVTSRTSAAGPTPAEAAAATSPDCRVVYALRNDSGTGFDAAVQVTNTSAEALPDWRLTFAFPGDQKVVQGQSARIQQQGQSVAVQPESGGSALIPGGSAAVEFTGAYRGDNPLPTEFHLNDATCVVQVSGASASTGAPSSGQAAGGAVVRPATRTAVKAAGKSAPKAGKGDSGRAARKGRDSEKAGKSRG